MARFRPGCQDIFKKAHLQHLGILLLYIKWKSLSTTLPNCQQSLPNSSHKLKKLTNVCRRRVPPNITARKEKYLKRYKIKINWCTNYSTSSFPRTLKTKSQSRPNQLYDISFMHSTVLFSIHTMLPLLYILWYCSYAYYVTLSIHTLVFLLYILWYSFYPYFSIPSIHTILFIAFMKALQLSSLFVT